jgi:hypothetical protein
MDWLEILEIAIKLGVPSAMLGLIAKIWNDWKNSRESDLCVLRQMMLNIYRKYEVEKIIPQYEAESFCRMYRVYKKRGGNSFIDELYNHVTEWELEI